LFKEQLSKQLASSIAATDKYFHGKAISISKTIKNLGKLSAKIVVTTKVSIRGFFGSVGHHFT